MMARKASSDDTRAFVFTDRHARSTHGDAMAKLLALPEPLSRKT
jgi:hypothetical protein